MFQKRLPNNIESYLGPPSILAGGNQYSMLITIPTDDLDNPLKDFTKILIKRQFLAEEQEEGIYMKNLIGFQNIFSPIKSGRMLISSYVNGLDSKEFSLNIMPATAISFEIAAERNHEYADGNQIVTFSTTKIIDSYNNMG